MTADLGQRWAQQYGPWAVIAGGSEGVGAEVASQIAEAGVNVVLVARRPEPLREVAESCSQRGVEVMTVAADLTDPDGPDQVLRACTAIDVGLLVCNAGANTCNAEFLDGELSEFSRVWDLNVTAPLALAHGFGRRMRERGTGGLLFIGSLSGYLGAARHTVYGGAKAFSRIFAEGLWLELRTHNVDVLHLVLGVTDTPAMRRVGLDFEVPGLAVSRPSDVAREALTHLSDGPVRVCRGNENNPMLGAVTDRARAVLSYDRTMRRLTAGVSRGNEHYAPPTD